MKTILTTVPIWSKSEDVVEVMNRIRNLDNAQAPVVVNFKTEGTMTRKLELVLPDKATDEDIFSLGQYVGMLFSKHGPF